MISQKITKKTPSQGKKFINDDVIAQAFEALQLEHNRKSEENYDLYEMSSNPFLYLNVMLSSLPSTINIRPVKISLKSSIYGKEFNTQIMLILTNEAYAKYKNFLKGSLENIHIISYDKVTKNFPSFTDKRNLLKKYELFFCDSHVYPLLKKALGRAFYERKRYPFAITFDDQIETDNVKEHIQEKIKDCLVECTYFYQGNGPEYSIKFARMKNFTVAQILSNAKIAFKGLFNILAERGITLKDVRRIIIKTEKSESLPIYSYLKPSEKKIIKELREEKVI